MTAPPSNITGKEFSVDLFINIPLSSKWMGLANLISNQAWNVYNTACEQWFKGIEFLTLYGDVAEQWDILKTIQISANTTNEYRATLNRFFHDSVKVVYKQGRNLDLIKKIRIPEAASSTKPVGAVRFLEDAVWSFAQTVKELTHLVPGLILNTRQVRCSRSRFSANFLKTKKIQQNGHYQLPGRHAIAANCIYCPNNPVTKINILQFCLSNKQCNQIKCQ